MEFIYCFDSLDWDRIRIYKKIEKCYSMRIGSSKIPIKPINNVQDHVETNAKFKII